MLARSLAASLLLVLASSSVASAQAWRLVDLGSLGGSHSCANAINNKGDIVGVSTLKDSQVSHAVLWSKGSLVELGALDGFASADAIGISDGGLIVGEAWIPKGPMDKKRAISWSAKKAATLGIARAQTPGGAAYDVNDAGLAVGRAFLGDPGTRSGTRATMLEKGAVTLVPVFDLPDGAGISTPELATAVNRTGTVAGAGRGMIAGKPLRRPFIYSKGVASDPIWAFDHVNPAWVNDLNDAGDLVVQRVVTKSGEADGKGLWQSLIVKGGKVTEVPSLEGFVNSELRAINKKGDAVGYSWNATGGTFPMIYVDGASVDPNKALTVPSEWKIVLLTDINDAGQVVGVARKGEDTHAILLEPANGDVAANTLEAAVVAVTPTWTTAFAGARPNPVLTSAGAQFAFTLAQRGEVTIQLTNVQGRRVRTLNGEFEAGPQTLAWDGRDDNGVRVGSGVLFARFAGLGMAATRKMVIAE
jgi:probable HAF family extracellular repeat protein